MAKKIKKTTKIKKYKKPINANIGMLIFGVIFFYIIVCILLSTRTSSISPYEVKEGSLAANYTYRGIAIRNEEVVYANKAGYINYYTRESERVAVGDLVYTIDETGRLKEYIQNSDIGESSLSEVELAELRSDIVSFMHSFNKKDFSTTYDFKYTMKGTVLKLENANLMDNISTINDGNELMSMVNFSNANETGIVTYWIDGYEELNVYDVEESMFDEKNYSKNQLISSELVAQEDPVYKIATDENWSIVIPIEASKVESFVAEEYIKVLFIKNQYKSWASVSSFVGQDGNSYLELKFNNGLLTFATDRFIDIELLLYDDTGLKIPNSSIVQKDFFLIPEEYIVIGGDNNSEGVIRESYQEDGTLYSEYVETSLYSYDAENKEYYIDISVLNLGDRIILPNSQETYSISKKSSLIGVYNINKGFADFREINILYQNEEYSIVKSNTVYGLNVYDYIVLDASAVSDDQLIFE